MWFRFTIGLALLPYLITTGTINAPILLVLLVLLGGGGAPAWDLPPTGLQAWFVLTMSAPVVIAGGVLAWWPDSNHRD